MRGGRSRGSQDASSSTQRGTEGRFPEYNPRNEPDLGPDCRSELIRIRDLLTGLHEVFFGWDLMVISSPQNPRHSIFRLRTR